MRGDTVFVMSQQIKPKFWTLSCKLWSIIITGLHNASEESSSLLRNPDTNTKLNFSSESKLCCCGHWLHLYLKWRPAVSMQIPMALNSTQHFSGDTFSHHSSQQTSPQSRGCSFLSSGLNVATPMQNPECDLSARALTSPRPALLHHTHPFPSRES